MKDLCRFNFLTLTLGAPLPFKRLITLGAEPQHLLKVHAGFNVALSLYDNVAYVAGGHEVPGVSMPFYVICEGLSLLSPGEEVNEPPPLSSRGFLCELLFDKGTMKKNHLHEKPLPRVGSFIGCYVPPHLSTAPSYTGSMV